MAFNVDPDLDHFTHIVPCGIGDRPVGSVAQILGGRGGVVSSSAGVAAPEAVQHDHTVVDGNTSDATPWQPESDPELMARATVALLAAFERVFALELVDRGRPPPL